jgi:hypothetical protein
MYNLKSVNGKKVNMAEVKAEVKECMICMEPGASWYKIGCNSSVSHEVCNTCEIQLRETAKPVKRGATIGKFVKCPLCRTDETKMGERTQESWMKETGDLYLSVDRNYAARRIHRLCTDVRTRDTQIRILQDELRHMQDENATLRQIFQALGVEGEALGIPAPRYAPVRAPVPAAPAAPAARAALVPEAAAPVRKVWCMSGRRELGTCPTKGKTQVKCKFVGCEKRVCQKCRQCTTH